MNHQKNLLKLKQQLPFFKVAIYSAGRHWKKKHLTKLVTKEKKIREGLYLNRANEVKMNKVDNLKLEITGRKK
jgi:hypothetical protein